MGFNKLNFICNQHNEHKMVQTRQAGRQAGSEERTDSLPQSTIHMLHIVVVVGGTRLANVNAVTAAAWIDGWLADWFVSLTGWSVTFLPFPIVPRPFQCRCGDTIARNKSNANQFDKNRPIWQTQIELTFSIRKKSSAKGRETLCRWCVV